MWFGAHSRRSYSCLVCPSLPADGMLRDSVVFTSKAGPEGRAALSPQCEQEVYVTSQTAPRTHRHTQGIPDGEQKKQPEMWTPGTELTLLGKQVGYLGPGIGEALGV